MWSSLNYFETGERLKNTLTRRLVALTLLVCLPAYAVLAESNPAILHCTGFVAVNGKTTNQSSAVFSGDRLQTGETSSVAITTRGTIVNIAPSSSAIYRDNAVEVTSGTVDFTTATGMAASVNGHKVTPATSGDVRYQVVKNGYCATLTATNGSVAISGRRDPLQQGNSTDLNDPRCDQAALPAGKVTRCAILPVIPFVIGGGMIAGYESLVKKPKPWSASSPSREP